MCIHVQSITYMHPDKDVLFSNVSFTISKGQKVALIGNNGSGKSTLMRLITKELLPSEGQIICPDIPYSIPQHFGQFNHLTVAGALGIERKLYALHAILQGDASIEHFTALADDWKIEEKAVAALNEWGLVGVPLSYPMHLLSGGEKTKVFLAGITIYSPAFILMDEPTNHLDMRSKDVLKEAIREFDGTVIIVSHDRDFLDGLATKVYEFGGGVVKEHLGGIYDFLQKKKIENLNELQKANPSSASPANGKKEEGAEEGISENKLSYEAQKELNKKIKKLERLVADCEAAIEQTESAIAILEEKMATPDGASDMSLYEQHQKLKQQLDHTVEEWERVSMELEEMNEK